MSKKHNENSLPLWAQERLNDLRHRLSVTNREMENVRAAHIVLAEREWFTLPGPPEGEEYPKDNIKLFILGHNSAFSVCSLHPKDVLLVGRHQSRFKKGV